jgi:hypothetical protein
MAKTKISEYSATAANNTDVANINIAEGCSPANVNNAIRGMMAHLKDFQAGNVAGNALAIAGGGTGAETASAARTNLGAASSGANSDITSLSGLTTALSTSQGGTALTSFTSGGAMYATSTSALTTGTLPVASGGTGATSLTANNVLLGNGTSALQTVAPGTSGNVLTSNGTTWTSAAAATGITQTTGSAPYYGARAWCDLDGTGTATLDASANISSVTDNGTGDYTLTFTTAMPDANYAVVFGTSIYSVNQVHTTTLYNSSARTTSSVRLQNYIIMGGGDTQTYPADYDPTSVAIFR